MKIFKTRFIFQTIKHLKAQYLQKAIEINTPARFLTGWVEHTDLCAFEPHM